MDPHLSHREPQPTAQRSSLRRLLVAAGLLIGTALLAWGGQDMASVERLSENESELRAWIRTRPANAVLLGTVAYTLLSLVPGSSGKSIIVGWLFGFASGLCVVMVGIVSGAVITFQLSRYVLQDIVEDRLRGFVGVINCALQRDGPFYLLSLRMAPVSYTLINYGCGATRLRFRTFLWTTFVGLLPTSTLLVYFGTQLPTLREVVTRGMWSVLEPSLIIGLFALAGLPYATRLLARTLLRIHRRLKGESRGSDTAVSDSRTRCGTKFAEPNESTTTTSSARNARQSL